MVKTTLKNIQEKKKIFDVCFDCGKKYGTKQDKGAIGTWMADCDICGEKKPCASAQHDFGIYNNPQEKIEDKIQDLI